MSPSIRSKEGSARIPTAIRRRLAEAFTRLELVLVIGVLAFLAALAVPTLANTKPRSQRIACVSNLRQIGQAFRMWAIDHDDLYPWLVPYVPDGGGGAGNPLKNNTYIQFSVISNELVTSRFLVCPSDPAKRTATDFTTAPSGGFMSPAYRDNALSYFAGLHATDKNPYSILTGDRNIYTSGPSSSCFFQGLTWALGLQDPNVRWTNSIHFNQGNLVRGDGRVEQHNSAGLRKAVVDAEGSVPEFSGHHVLLPP